MGEGNQPVWYVAYVECSKGQKWLVQYTAGGQETLTTEEVLEAANWYEKVQGREDDRGPLSGTVAWRPDEDGELLDDCAVGGGPANAPGAATALQPALAGSPCHAETATRPCEARVCFSHL